MLTTVSWCAEPPIERMREQTVNVFIRMELRGTGSNRGKQVAGTIWGNHVADWENVTVRFQWQFDEGSGQWLLRGPLRVKFAAHDSGTSRSWNEVEKVDGTHPVSYAAWGSHGNYPNAGNVVYEKGLGLTDRMSAGTKWDTWKRGLVLFDYAKKKGLSQAGWPTWLGTDFWADGDKKLGPENPEAGGVYRWGNTESGCADDIGHCRLEDGPTGPVSKSAFRSTSWD